MVELLEPLSALELSRISGANLTGNPSVLVSRLGALDELSDGVLSFYADTSMTKKVDSAQAGILFCEPSLVRPNERVTYLVCPEPKVAFSKIAAQFALKISANGVSPQANIHPDARLGINVTVGPFAVIETGAVVGKNCRIAAHTFIGAGAVLGEDCEIFPRVVILDGVRIGNRVKIYPGAVIGSSGFGYFQSKTAGLVELPQIGTVIIEDDVRIGANSSVDRATLNQTVIGRGTKIDNLVQVGHNTKIGRFNLLCGCSGVSGSVTTGDGVVLGAAVTIGDGVNIGAGAQLGMSTSVPSDLEAGKAYRGDPPVGVKEFFRQHLSVKKLPELFKRLREIEKRLGIGGETT